ncbi:enoyl-CoA hydratase/isomerase family protein [Peterkaempfera bronchialis]|uniref:Enoyl-CoA hydratase/isomerase family protein n=1 Tax=Peterkaempfera bronchialis TaxID=2126346 RepID=A0A345SRE5_9ACTN|nr:enoyl-CoA hydratase/isomerase family protein [Peterkaempfera bronchialis]AXI76300.1 enoyl-CoA hydratase/isomerase family protein [Peterkaempfera bronchialis]
MLLTVGQVAEDLSGRTGSIGLDDAGRVRHRLTVVDLDTAPGATTAQTAEVARRIAAGPGVVVGVAERPDRVPDALLDAVTLTLAPRGAADDRRTVASADVAQDLETLRRSADRNPAASAVLDQVLRGVAGLPVADALRLESFAYSTLLAGPEFAAWLDRRGPRATPVVPERCVLVERSGEALRITLNHPGRRNAYSAAVRDALVDALDVAVLDPSVREVELRGNGPAFCSGGDLAEFGTAPDPVSGHLIRTGRSAAALLAGLSARTHVRLHGHCVGAGIELPSFASRVTAAPDVAIRLPEIAMGLIPGAGGTVGITRRIGRWRTAYLALTGAVVDARSALAWGLVDEVRPVGG